MKKFYDLDDRINYVATKVVHLGDQLENISTPRQRVQEAQQVMQYFQEFNSPHTISTIFLDPKQVGPHKKRLFHVSLSFKQLLPHLTELIREDVIPPK